MLLTCLLCRLVITIKCLVISGVLIPFQKLLTQFVLSFSIMTSFFVTFPHIILFFLHRMLFTSGVFSCLIVLLDSVCYIHQFVLIDLCNIVCKTSISKIRKAFVVSGLSVRDLTSFRESDFYSTFWWVKGKITLFFDILCSWFCSVHVLMDLSLGRHFKQYTECKFSTNKKIVLLITLIEFYFVVSHRITWLDHILLLPSFLW